MRVSDALVEKLLLDTRSATAEQLKAVRADNQGTQKPLQDLAIQI